MERLRWLVAGLFLWLAVPIWAVLPKNSLPDIGDDGLHIIKMTESENTL